MGSKPLGAKKGRRTTPPATCKVRMKLPTLCGKDVYKNNRCREHWLMWMTEKAKRFAPPPDVPRVLRSGKG